MVVIIVVACKLTVWERPRGVQPPNALLCLCCCLSVFITHFTTQVQFSTITSVHGIHHPRLFGHYRRIFGLCEDIVNGFKPRSDMSVTQNSGNVLRKPKVVWYNTHSVSLLSFRDLLQDASLASPSVHSRKKWIPWISTQPERYWLRLNMDSAWSSKWQTSQDIGVISTAPQSWRCPINTI